MGNTEGGKMEIFQKRPEPDFEEFRKVLMGEKDADRVHLVELLFDQEIKREITEKYLGERWVDLSIPEKFYLQEMNFWYRMGYDYVRMAGGLFFRQKVRETADTAGLSRGQRGWAEEGTGIIQTWEDFEKYPWQKKEEIDYTPYEVVSRNLPEGMKMLVCPSSGVFEVASEALLGFENMSYLIVDNYPLVEAVFNKVGELIYDFYKNAVEIDNVEGFFQGDDMGFKTSTFLSPKHTKQLVLSWHKRYASLAHSKNKMYWLHCCGNVLEIMDYLIEEVKIDAFHSFQDEIIPVGEFKRTYGNKIAVLGGVDVDKLCNKDENLLRKYVHKILDECMPSRYALGSGNSIANYIPVENYLAMLDEGARWQR